MKRYILFALAAVILAFAFRVLGDEGSDIRNRLAKDGVDAKATVLVKEMRPAGKDTVPILRLGWDVPGVRRFEKDQEVATDTWEKAAANGEVDIRYSKENPEVLRVAGDDPGNTRYWLAGSWAMVVIAIHLVLLGLLKRRRASRAK